HADSFCERLCATAKTHGITVVAGMFAPVPGTAPRNRMIVAGSDGSLRAHYDKVHLFDAFTWRESDKVSATPTDAAFSELCTFRAGEFTVGLMNCYDLRFPELSRVLADRGCDVLLVSSAWVAGPQKEQHWEKLLRARAIENTCYVVASNQPGPGS